MYVFILFYKKKGKILLFLLYYILHMRITKLIRTQSTPQEKHERHFFFFMKDILKAKCLHFHPTFLNNHFFLSDLLKMKTRSMDKHMCSELHIYMFFTFININSYICVYIIYSTYIQVYNFYLLGLGTKYLFTFQKTLGSIYFQKGMQNSTAQFGLATIFQVANQPHMDSRYPFSTDLHEGHMHVYHIVLAIFCRF